MTAKEAVEMAKKNGAKVLDIKFIDLPGTWQHITLTPPEITEEVIKAGWGFDGSSIRGFQEIQESDMFLLPDASTAFMDPACTIPTLSMIADIIDPITRKPYSRDARYVARKAEDFLKASGLADVAYFGPEAEFFIFDSVRYDQSQNEGYYHIDSNEGEWNTGREEKPNLAYKVRYKEGYFPTPPTDTLMDIRSEMVMRMKEVGVEVEVHHHEVATAGQAEIGVKYDSLVNMADKMMKYKHCVKNVARAHNKVATFMPKPLFADNGSGMHVHQSLWKAGTNLFYDEKGYAQLSDMAKWYIGGLLKHARALLAFAAPSTNSYQRLVPGYEAPVNLVYSARNRSAAVRIPMYSTNPKTKRIEFRPPDPSANPYLCFAALLMAGLDGIKNKIDPGAPMDTNIFELSAEEMKKVKTVTGSLEESLNALEADHDFLMQGGVFTQDLIDMWIGYKRVKEHDMVRIRPHPYEFYLYLDA